MLPIMLLVLVPILVEAFVEYLEFELLLHFEALGSQVLELPLGLESPLLVEVLQLQVHLTLEKLFSSYSSLC